jgi:hypothetical protein
MKYFVIALMLLYPIEADAQRANRARATGRSNTATSGAPQQHAQQAKSHQPKPRSARAEALSRSVEEVRMPAGWNTPAVKPPSLRNGDHDWRRPAHRPAWRPDRFPHRWPGGSYYTTPYSGYVGYGWGFYPPWPDGAAESEAPPPPIEETSTTATRGLLRLEITPASGLDYYVDGVFIGNSSTLGSDIELNAGARRVEVRAAGYKPLVFDVRIAVGRETTFRGVMEPLVQPQAPQATGNRTMYIIPGCYVGNSPPSAAGLRAGCDINKLITK